MVCGESPRNRKTNRPPFVEQCFADASVRPGSSPTIGDEPIEGQPRSTMLPKEADSAKMQGGCAVDSRPLVGGGHVVASCETLLYDDNAMGRKSLAEREQAHLRVS